MEFIKLVGKDIKFSADQTGAYQIKGNRQCSNMVANILPVDPPPPPDPGGGFKLKGITNAATR